MTSPDDYRESTASHEATVVFLIGHQRTSVEACGCGWSKLGESHTRHLLTVLANWLRAIRVD